MEDLNRLVRLELGLMSRRLRGMAMISRGIVPNLVISQRVVDRVVKAAQSYLADETGETMVGLVVDNTQSDPEAMPTLYVLDTIAPDESTIRRSHMFEQGDDLQGDIFLWLLDNWNAYLDIGRDMQGKPIKDAWKTPLKHLGDWHKQPGYMIQPSGGDLMTALRIMDDEENEFEFLLVPIVTLGHPDVTTEEGAIVNYFTVPMGDGTSLRMDWWYIHRDVRIFQPITPRIVPTAELPVLTPYSWHILDVDLLDEELALIEEDGMFMMIQQAILYEADGDLPLEICFIIGRAGWQNVFLVVTDWNYPNVKPRVKIAPFEGIDATMYAYDVFSQLWANAQPAPKPADFEWNPNKSYIVDYLAAIEKQLGIRTKPLPQELIEAEEAAQAAANSVVSIPVDHEEDDDASSDTEAKDQTSDNVAPVTADADGASAPTADAPAAADTASAQAAADDAEEPVEEEKEEETT